MVNLAVIILRIMIVSLPNGKVVEMSLEQYLRMTDEDFQFMVAQNWGEEVNNPFHGSVLEDGEYAEIPIPETFADEVAIEDIIDDLTDIDPSEKLSDEDFIDDNLEV